MWCVVVVCSRLFGPLGHTPRGKPSEDIGFGKTPIFAEAKTRNAVPRSFARVLINPGRRHLEHPCDFADGEQCVFAYRRVHR